VSRVRLDFLNWRPDADDFENSLTEAKNVLHRPNGWVPFQKPTSGAISTNTSIGTCPSMIVKPVGTNNQSVACFLHGATLVSNTGTPNQGYRINMCIGLVDSAYTTMATYTSVTSNTISTLSTGNSIAAFDVCELNDKLFFVARAECTTTPTLSGGTNTVTSVNLVGYANA